MKRASIFFMLVFFNKTILYSQMADIATSHELFLVFEDEFNNTSLDIEKWEFLQNGAMHSRIFPANVDRELQYYTNGNNLSFADGKLSITSLKQDAFLADVFDYFDANIMYYDADSNAIIIADQLANKRNFYFTSGEIDGKQKFQYGVFEINAKMPAGYGFWPALWLYGANPPPSNEIDINEFEGDKPWMMNTNIHCAFNGTDLCPNNGQSIDASQIPFVYNNAEQKSLSEGFHTYTFVWSENRLQWWLDGYLARQTDISFSIPSSIIVNFAVGGPPFDDAEYKIPIIPDTGVLEIEYIKVWSIGNPLPTCDATSDLLITSGGTIPNIPNYLPNTTISAKNTIVTSGNVSPLPGQTWRSGEYIDLNPGFETPDGQEWTAEIGDCNELFARLANQDSTKNKGAETDTVAQNGPGVIPGNLQANVKDGNSGSPKEFNKQPPVKEQQTISGNQQLTDASEPIIITPNPSADGKFSLNCTLQGIGCMNAEINIMNTLGQTILQEPFNRYSFPISIDLSGQPKGAYFIKIINAEKVIVQKIISQ